MTWRAPLVGALALATATLAGCTNPAPSPSDATYVAVDGESSPSAQSPEPQDFVLTSPDFAQGQPLPESAKATAFDGQCTGPNTSPALAWSGAPEATAAFAITLTDASAGNFVHWAKADIPADVTGIAVGAADAVAGVGGETGQTDGTYFGPCPPDGEHEYVFTVYALDAPLGLDPGFDFSELLMALPEHAIAQATLTGTASPRE